MMNEKAAELGCMDTYFITPNGLDKEDENGFHGTTAADLARIMSYCIKESPMKETFLDITQTPSYSFSNIEGTRNYSCNNHNRFLTMMDGAISGKPVLRAMPDTVMWEHCGGMTVPMWWHFWAAAGQTIRTINGQTQNS